MAPRIKLTEAQSAAIKQYLGVPLGKLREIEGIVRSAKWITPEEFEAAAKGLLGDEAEAISVVRAALLRRSMSQGASIESSQATDAIKEAVRSSDEKVDQPPSEIDEKLEVLQDLASSEAVRMISKALELSYEYANLYRSSIIVTDIRPVFNEGVNALTGAIVSYTFRVRYNTNDCEKELNIALDTLDVKELMTQCERALTKARVAKDHMQQTQSAITTMIAGGNP